MHISKVHIENFRNFEKITVETGTNLILVGANATGKSNFIHALKLVLDPSLSRHDRLLTADDFWRGENVEPWDGREIKISVELTDFDTDVNLNTLLNAYCPQGKPGTARLNYVFRYRPRAGVAAEKISEGDYEAYLYGGDDPDDQSREFHPSELRDNFSFKVINALRDAESELVAKGLPLKSLFELYGITAEALKDVADYIVKANEELKKVKQIQTLESTISTRLIDMIEHIHDLDPTLRLLESNAESLIRAIRLRIEGDRPISSTSLGLANVLFLTLYILEVERREDPTKPPTRTDEWHFTILAIEEPEAHLHPHLQRLLFRDFLKRTPLILSTHSPHIASVAGVDSIVMFRKPDETVGSEICSTANLQDNLTPVQLNDLERYLDVTRAEILFARGVIFVEGDAEEFLLPILAQIAGFELDRYGITVCNVRGTDFVPYVRLVGNDGLQIPFVVLTDGDKYARLNDGLVKARDGNYITEEEFDELKKLAPYEQRQKLDDLEVAYYYGLKRCIDLLEAIDISDSLKTEIESHYEDLDWSSTQNALKRIGIFVNDSSFEPSLIEQGYGEVLIDILETLGAGPRVVSRLRNHLENDELREEENIEYFVDKISEIGKGRVAQRLSSKVKDQVGRIIPPYILTSIQYLVMELEPKSSEQVDDSDEPTNAVIAVNSEESDLEDTSDYSDQDEIPF